MSHQRASTRFASIPELLRMMGDVILNRNLLYTLCLVNKTFNNAFTPALYAEIDIDHGMRHLLGAFPEESHAANPHQYRRTKALQDNRNLHHVRKLCYSGPGWSLPDYDGPANLRALLGRMPLLKEIVLSEQTLSHDMAQGLVASCPKLGKFAIIHSFHIRNRAYGSKSMRYVAFFRGLTSLVLANVYVGYDNWKHDLVSALKASPSLEELALSTQAHQPPWGHRFPELCNAYADSGGQPLRLRRLSLGKDFILERENSAESRISSDGEITPSTESSLSKLTDPSFLEDIYLDNRYPHSSPAWWSFSENSTPNLRRFSAYQYTKEVHHFLRSCSEQYAAQLSISFLKLFDWVYNTEVPSRSLFLSPEELSDRPAIALKFRMTEACANPTPEYRSANGYNLPTTFPQVLRAGIHLSGLFLRMPRCNTIPIFKTEFDYTVKSLEPLHSLQHLQIACTEGICEWLVERQTQAPEEVISLVRSVGDTLPSLRNFKLGSCAWSIERNSKGKVQSLHALDRHEQLEVERFRAPFPFWPYIALENKWDKRNSHWFNNNLW